MRNEKLEIAVCATILKKPCRQAILSARLDSFLLPPCSFLPVSKGTAEDYNLFQTMRSQIILLSATGSSIGIPSMSKAC